MDHRKKGQLKNIIYIGSTPKTITERNSQHEAGFKREKGRGRTLANEVSEILKRGDSISIYVRRSSRRTIFGYKVSLQDAEEKALIRKFRKEHRLINIRGKNDDLTYDEIIKLVSEQWFGKKEL